MTDPMTLNEAYEYVEHANEAEGEQRAEYGSGAVSLGYDSNEAMAHYDGYRTSDDPTYREAAAMIAAYKAAYSLVTIVRWAPPGMTWQQRAFGRWECVAASSVPF